MEQDVWNVVEKQRQQVIDDPPTSVEDFRSGFPKGASLDVPWDGDKSEGVPPISSYTKGCAWASDYVWANRRAIVFLNPDGLHDRSLEEFISREFGCSRRTFVQQVADGWLLPTLDRKEEYRDGVRANIQSLFADVAREGMDLVAVPRYANLVEEAFGAAIVSRSSDTDGYVLGESSDAVDLDATVAQRKQREPWSNLPDAEFFFHDVRGSFREFVTDRVTRLELAERVLTDTGIGPAVESIRDRVSEYSGGDFQSLLRETYLAWKLLGVPMYECEFSGTTDIGQNIATTYEEHISDVLDGIRSESHENGAEVLETVDAEMTPIRLPDRDAANVESLFGISPKEHGLVPGELDALAERIEEHEWYYERSRDGLTGPSRQAHPTDGGVQVFPGGAGLTDSPVGWYSRMDLVQNARWSDVGLMLFTEARAPELSAASDPINGSDQADASMMGCVVGVRERETENRYEWPSPEINEVETEAVDIWNLQYEDRQSDITLSCLTT